MGSLFSNSMNCLRRPIQRITGTDRLTDLLEHIRNMAAFNAWRELLRGARYSDPRVLSRYGFKVHSQAEEDGIIHEIFRRIGSTRKTFMEIGVSNGLECNTLYLLRQGWTGTWIDGNTRYVKDMNNIFGALIARGGLRCVSEFVTRENINKLYKEFLPPQGLDLLSIDIDGNDYHILAAITDLGANVIVLEYNPVFAPPIEWVMDYNENHTWTGNDKYSASLKSYEKMLSSKGYILVGCTTNGNNAFFVRRSVTANHFHDDCTAEFHYEPQRFWLTQAFISGHPYNGDR